jgi:hypothetical protein
LIAHDDQHLRECRARLLKVDLRAMNLKRGRIFANLQRKQNQALSARRYSREMLTSARGILAKTPGLTGLPEKCPHDMRIVTYRKNLIHSLLSRICQVLT